MFSCVMVLCGWFGCWVWLFAYCRLVCFGCLWFTLVGLGCCIVAWVVCYFDAGGLVGYGVLRFKCGGGLDFGVCCCMLVYVVSGWVCVIGCGA